MGKKKAAPQESPAPKKGKGDKKTKPEEPPAASKNKKGKREESSPTPDANKPQRGLAIGDNFGWTGKLPATLVYEHCQKNKWGKPVFDMRKSSKGFTGVVKLTWESPKREKVEVVMIPDSETYSPKDTTNEARHFAATYVLYRINYMKNMKLMLPVIFRDYWVELEMARLTLLKENKQAHDSKYNSHPFQAKLDAEDRRAKWAKEREVRDAADAKTKRPTISLATGGVAKPKKITVKSSRRTFPKKVWDRAPFIDFSPEIRTKVEREILQHLDWNSGHSDDKQDRARMIDLGFRTQHVDEAFTHAGSYTDALEWLLFHLPEDDLPPLFAKRNQDLAVRLKITGDLKMEYAKQRMSQSGNDADAILAALTKFDNNEVEAAVFLTNELIGVNTDEFQEDEDCHMLWKQELEGIEMVGTHSPKYVNGEETIVDIPLSPVNLQSDVLTLRIFRGKYYPQQLPGIHLVVTNSHYKLANYIKLAAIHKLGAHLQPEIGGPVVFSILEWVEANISAIIDNPGKLSITPINRSQNKSQAAISMQKRSGKKLVVSQSDLKAIEDDYKQRSGTSQMKNMIEARKSLPAWAKRQQLVDIITSNQVTLVTGETGSGKSTQIVQFLLDYLNDKGDYSGKIMCTQPRRISTIGLADRISEERTSKTGQETGYIIRGENRTNARTRLSFVTTGVLLRMLQQELTSGGSLFDHLHYIFVDEVHERSVDSDFLLIILKQILPKLPHLKVVLMSATIDTSKFMTFFNTPVNHVHIEGRTFPIEDVYLEDLLVATNYTIERDGERVIPKADSPFFAKGTINYELMARVCSHIDEKLDHEGNDGSILVFMPGIMEISKLCRELVKEMGEDVMAVPLHSALSNQDQKKVFVRARKGVRKVVVSTNIAETSITIPDCVAVIDSGRAKSVFFDPTLNATRLVENWCSQAEVGQRRGRSGRITNGTCYHMYAKPIFEKMPKQPVPEIMRTRLENLFLVVKAMGISDVHKFLSGGLDVPDSSSMDKASSYLNDIGAVDDYGELTHLGKHLSYLPTDISSGKLMILGCIFGCLEPCLILAASTSTGSPFLNLQDERDEIKRIQKTWSEDQGDLVAICNVVQAYENEAKNKKFISVNKLSYLTLQDILSTKQQYLSMLREMGFVPMDYNQHKAQLNRNSTNYPLLRAIISGALYPQLARVQLPDPKFFKSSVGAVAVDPDAKTIKLFMKNDNYDTKDLESSELPATRSFIHPSSTFFGSNDVPTGMDMSQITNDDGEINISKARELFDLTPKAATSSSNLFKNSFMAYRSSHQTTKLWVRELTPTSTFAALMFGGALEYEISGGVLPGVVLDSWIPVRMWCKNAVLIKKLRALLDKMLDQRLGSPGTDGDEVLDVIEKLLSSHY